MSDKSAKDMRTPLGKVRGLGSAKDGTDHFWRQRVTAVANVPLLLFFIWIVVSLNGADHAEVAATLSHPFVAFVMLGVILSVCIHMKLGMQVIIEDYIHSEGAKVVCVMLNIFFCSAIGIASAFAVLKLGFGG
jgi:succinate dehydrogenase / fumarate reductase membrane anchor subunit